MLRIENLEVRGLKPVSLDVAPGECVAIQGPSGSGKTVFLRALADLDPAQGQIYLDDTERGSVSGPEWRSRVRYAAAEPGWWSETPRAHFAAVGGTERLVTDLGLRAAQLDQSIAELSTGERQRIALVRAVQDSPQVLLLDEPTGALDSKATARAEKLIRKQLGAGCIIVFVSHDPAQVKRLATRKLVIRRGKLSESRA